MSLKSIIFSLFIFTIHLQAQIDGFPIRKISPDGGYGFRAINTIRQDLSGYMWFGSDHGLIKYDSKNETFFVANPTDSLALPSNIILDIAVDKNNFVWVISGSGVCLFDRTIQKFHKIEMTYEDGTTVESTINNIIVDENNNLWFSNTNYLGIYNRKTNRLIRINKDQPIHITVLYINHKNRLWFGDEKGNIYTVTSNNKSYEKIIIGNGISAHTISIHQNKLFVSYKNHGLRQYNLKGELIKHFKLDASENNIEQINIRSLLKDTYGRLWIGAYEGLYLYKKGKINKLNSEYNNGHLNNSIHELFEDNQGGVWVGTWSGGVSYIHPSDNKFENFKSNKAPFSLTNNIVSSFSQIDNQKILVGTEEGGLNIFNKKTKKFNSLHIKDGVHHIKSTLVDRFGNIWIGTYGNGLWHKSPKNKTFKQISNGNNDGSHISKSDVYSLCEIDSGILIGTYGGGINFYDFKTKQIHFINTSKSKNKGSVGRFVRCLYSDSSNNIWVGTNSGIYNVNLKERKLEKYHPTSGEVSALANITVYSITELSNNILWFGLMDGGVITLNQKTEQLRHLEMNGLLKGENVCGIIQDTNNNVWISSSNGLIQYDPNTHLFRHFITKDGIQGNIFNPQAIFEDNEGFLYFGGTSGFTIINPQEIRLNTRKPKTLINKIIVNNQNTKYPVLQSNNNYNEIQLNPFETTIRVGFSSDNYLLSKKNLFKYRLVNYYDEWVDAGNDGSVMFANLPNKDFILEIKACNNDGIWNETPTILPISIKKYWYKTSLAYLLCFIFIIGISIVLIRFVMERSKLKKMLLIANIQKNFEEQNYEMKLKFFTNISHELRTPLTLITLPLSKLISSGGLTLRQQELVDVIKMNSDRLLQLVNQVLDFRKIEKGHAKLVISQLDIVKLIKEIKLHFIEKSKTKEIQFDFFSSAPEIFIEADRDKTDKIIFNLLSNAFKHTPINGKILMSISENEQEMEFDFSDQLSFGTIEGNDHIKISISNTGLGIKKENLPKIFNRFEQTNTKEEVAGTNEIGTGIGLDLCKEFTLLHGGRINVKTLYEKGAKFTVTLHKKLGLHKSIIENPPKVKNLEFVKNSINAISDIEKEQKEYQLLIVEDHNDLRKFIGGLLNDSYKIKYATNGKEGLKILKNTQIDLIISDVMMPEMDGFEFCSSVKSQLETSHIPIILLTALAAKENIIMGLENGGDAYLSKPIEEKVLLSQVLNLISQRNRLRKSFQNLFILDKSIEGGNLDNYFIRKLNKAIESNYKDDQFSVEKLAMEINLSRSQLHRKLVSLTNRTTSEYINLYRIKKASELLLTSKYNINEVSYEVGYTSTSYFSKNFKSIYNKTPKEFIKSKKRE
ncbi:two-component regulator propeller domain-containing protein [Flavicella sp.]|uniref:hybrid sensor histidine kinase/response regulator transcription factor n=1 Tax=Flavicella sp. TaxID=2957742 RepID=UPI00301A51DE